MRRALLAAAAAMQLAGGAAAAERPPVEHYAPDEAAQAAARAGGFRLPFSSAVRVGDVLYLSGVIGTRDDGTLAPGIEAQTRQTMANIGAMLKRAGRSFDDVFKCTVMIDDMREWQAFNRVYVTYFKPDRLPARSAFGADGLALGALVEVECLAHAPER
ncbi:MAG TPA: RidA family protein [Allosphingosinicella sp.]|nr:RidA family protein [Allosphingosinicella sp.]